MEEDDFKKLPVEDRCVHKLWKARVHAYEELIELFRKLDDEKSPEYGKYLGLVKKFVIDGNAMGQEKGLEATLAYVENYAHAGKTVSEVMSGIVTKCMSAPKTKTRELALQVTLMYIEIEKGDAVIEELVKGMDQKNPKIVAACVTACTSAIKEFGLKIVHPKPIVKKLPALFSDRDKTVRDEAKHLTVEMYRWMGPALRNQLNSLQPIQLTELESEFAKLDGQKAVPTRYIKSQQQKQAILAAEKQEQEENDEDEEDAGGTNQIDTYDMADPVDILSKLPKDFYEKLEAKKWQERKEALELLENLLKTPKLENGDYGDMVRALKKIVQKDSNVVVVALAGRCLASLSAGLKKRFQTYAGPCVPALLEKFKEKKQNVVTATRDAIDAIYLTTTLEAVLEDVLEALGNKNPSVKAETSMFLARGLSKTQPTVLNKKMLKSLVGGLVKCVNEPDPSVRDSACEALGTLMKLVGEKAVRPFLTDLEKDNLKMTKVKECCEKAVITVKVAAPKKERPNTAASKKPEQKVELPKSAPAATNAKTTTKPGLKKRTEISSGTATVVRSKGPKAAPVKKSIEKELSDSEVDEAISSLVASEIIGDVSSANWKSRLAAVEQLLSTVQQLESSDLPCQALVRFLCQKPGLKDTNFQVLKAKMDVIKYLAENGRFSCTTADVCLKDIVDKLGDAKNGSVAAETITAIAESASFPHVGQAVLDFGLEQKSPKTTQEALVWMSNAIQEFGFSNLEVKNLIENCKNALKSSNPGVRQAAITLLGTMFLYIGPSLITCFDAEKPALKEQIQAEFDKNQGKKPPAPSRGMSKSESAASLSNLEENNMEETVVMNVQDLLPKVDISSQITESLINEIKDKNWKVRNEALTKVSTIIQEAKSIKPNIGELPQALAERLNDSNTKIAQSSLNLCEAIVKAMGPPAKQHIRTLFPGFLQALGDNKSWMRTTALETINAFAQTCGYKEFFESEMIADALKSGSPALRTELWTWLGENLPKIPLKSIPKEELVLCIPHLYANLEDRNADVRKNAQEAVLGYMIHLGYEAMLKLTEKLKPSSKNGVVQALEKVRPNLPVKALPKKQVVEKEDKAVRGTKPVANSKNAVKPKATKPPTPNRKKEEDVDTSPLLSVNNLKNQRFLDEQKLKVLKWNFTTPREEFVDLLRDQMNTAGVNKTLIANMFHSDFRYHLKALESLSDDLAENSDALIANLDLVLKWLTLRFFDTNPSVLLKGLEYLNNVFRFLDERRYKMPENEGSCFIPYLLVKIGDPKDAVRNGVKSLFRQIPFIYPISRMFSYIMEGLKTKNSRQRAECLEVLGEIIETDGLTVCSPSPASCLKEIAKQISDRDNSVRNGALNCVVQAYFIVGEKVFKMLGNISSKDLSLLEERIKRAPRPQPKVEPKPTINTTTMVRSPKSAQSSARGLKEMEQIEDQYATDEEKYQDEEEDDDFNLPPVTLPTQIAPKPQKELDGKFKLDPEFMKELESVKIEIPQLNLLEFDLAFLDEEVKLPPRMNNAETDVKARIVPISPPKPINLNDEKINLITKEKQPEINSVISVISSPDMHIALGGLDEINKILNSSRSNLLIDLEDDFMISITQQLKYLYNRNLSVSPAVLQTYRSILTVVDAFYHNKILGRHISIPVLKDVLNEFLKLLVFEKLGDIPDTDTYTRVINLHSVKLIQRSDHTNTLCALVILLQECLRNDSTPRQIELVMKCLWRVLKLLPTWGNDIRYEVVLAEFSIFFNEFPPAWWKNKVDTPFRTIKTILHSFLKIRGSLLLNDLEKVPNKHPELEICILKQMKVLKLNGPQPNTVANEVSQLRTPASNSRSMQDPSTPSPRRSLSKTNHAMLTEIFQKIGNKEETKEGLLLLYDFLQQHPDAQIEPFLQKCSTFFQDYIKNGLQNIKDEKETLKHTVANQVVEKVQASIMPQADVDPAERGPDYWYERLEMWRKVYPRPINK